MTGDLIVKGATLSGEFVEMFYKKGDVLQSQIRKCLCKIYMYVYVHAGVYVCTCVHVWVRGEFTVL